MKRLSISILGAFRVELDGEPITDFATDKTRALLAFLVVEADRPHRRDALAGMLWPDFPHKKALQNLRKTLSRLRKALREGENNPPFLLVDSKTVLFNPSCEVELDVAAFETLDQACSDHRHRGRGRCLPCVRRMERMVDLYQGDLFDQFFLGDSDAFEEWVTTTREGLQRRAVSALRYLIDYCQQRGETKRALRLAWRQVELQPWREDAHRQLMILLAESKQRGAALAQYAVCRRILADELDIEPTAETTALYQRIKAHGASEPYRSRSSHTVNLPPPTTPFTGREEELADLAERLANPDCRLLTLVGPGGIGKTRLALQAAADHVGMFHHGVCFVSLAAIDTASLIAPTIVDALPFSLHGNQDPGQQLLDYLQEKELLLVLDDMEHVLDGSDLFSQILRHAPEVVLLVTSRERLRLHEEWVYQVDGLTYPQDPTSEELERYSAVTLFLQTARRIQHKFALTDAKCPWVRRICQLVEGMPLAVELAAAWMPARSCEEVAREIERNLDVLESTLRNLPPRHRSVSAAFEHSWSMLSPEERGAFRDLSVFRGGFRAKAAEQGIGVSPAMLTALVEKSLLRRDSAGRYQMHGLLRQYAAEKLQHVPRRQQTTRDRHAAYFAGYLQEREEWLRGRRQGQALEEIDSEIENVRAAWQWAVTEGRAQVIVIEQALGSLGTFYLIRGWYSEGSDVLRQAVARLAGKPDSAPRYPRRDSVLGQVLAWQGNFAYQLGAYAEAESLLRKSLEILRRCGGQRERAFSLLTLAQLLCHARHDYPEAARRLQQSLEIYRQIDDPYGMAQALDGLGDVAARQGLNEKGRARYKAGLALRREIGDLWGISTSLGSLGGLAGRMGEYDRSRQRFEESLAICREIGSQRGIAASLHNLSTLAYLKADYAEAQRLRRETLEICREIGYRWGVASSLKSLGDVYRQLGEYERAQRSLQESLAILEKMNDRRAQAFTLNSLGTVAGAMGNQEAAWDYFERALEAAIEIQEPPIVLDVLSGMAHLLAADGRRAYALELATFASHHPASEQQTKDQSDSLQAELVAGLPSAVVAAAQARGRARELEETTAEILETRIKKKSEV